MKLTTNHISALRKSKGGGVSCLTIDKTVTPNRQLLSHDLDEMIRLDTIKYQHPIIQQLAVLRGWGK